MLAAFKTAPKTGSRLEGAVSVMHTRPRAVGGIGGRTLAMLLVVRVGGSWNQSYLSHASA